MRRVCKARLSQSPPIANPSSNRQRLPPQWPRRPIERASSDSGASVCLATIVHRHIERSGSVSVADRAPMAEHLSDHSLHKDVSLDSLAQRAFVFIFILHRSKILLSGGNRQMVHHGDFYEVTIAPTICHLAKRYCDEEVGLGRSSRVAMSPQIVISEVTVRSLLSRS
jgi:hypothetical protein